MSNFEIVARVTSKESDQTPWVHPLDTEEIKTYLSNTLSPDLVVGLSQAIRPSLSPDASEREKEEAEAIKTRRKKQSVIENTGSWAIRTMYEETFGVTPATLGGIISHTIEVQKINLKEVSAQTLNENLTEIGIGINTKENNEILTQIATAVQMDKINHNDAFKLLTNILELGNFTNKREGMIHIPYHLRETILANPESPLANDYFKQPTETGLALIQANNLCTHHLTGICEDPRLIEAFPAVEENTRRSAIRRIWHELGGIGPVFKSDGTYNDSHDHGFSDGLNKLAIVRSSPDFSFLYNRFSVTGSLHTPSE